MTNSTEALTLSHEALDNILALAREAMNRPHRMAPFEIESFLKSMVALKEILTAAEFESVRKAFLAELVARE